MNTSDNPSADRAPPGDRRPPAWDRWLWILTGLVVASVVVTVALSPLVGYTPGNSGAGSSDETKTLPALVAEFVLLGLLLFAGLVRRSARRAQRAGLAFSFFLFVCGGVLILFATLILLFVTCSVATSLATRR
jgi:hypothetical protein